MTRKDVEALFARRDDVLNRHDVEGFTALYAADAVIASPTSGTVRGRTALAGILHGWLAGFPDLVFMREALVVDGDCAVSVGETRGTDTGGFMGLAPSGKPFRLPVVAISTVRDGAIVDERWIYDFTGMLMQLGVLKTRS